MRIKDGCVRVQVSGEITLYDMGETPVTFTIDIEAPAPIVSNQNSYDRETGTWEVDQGFVQLLGQEVLKSFAGAVDNPDEDEPYMPTAQIVEQTTVVGS